MWTLIEGLAAVFVVGGFCVGGWWLLIKEHKER